VCVLLGRVDGVWSATPRNCTCVCAWCEQVYAVIKERANGGHGVTVCGRQSHADSALYSAEEPVYLSDSNSVEVRVIAARSTKDGRQFLLRYQGW